MRRLLLPIPLPCLLLLLPPVLLILPAEVRPRRGERSRAREAGVPAPRPLAAAPAPAGRCPGGGTRRSGRRRVSGGAGVRPELGLCPAAVPLVPPREGRGGWGGRRRGPAEAALTWSGRRPDPRGLGLPGAPRLPLGGLSPPRPLGGWRPGSVQAGMWWQYDPVSAFGA